MPLTCAVEIRVLGDAAQVTGLIGIGTRRAVPVVRPERIKVAAAKIRRNVLAEPGRLLSAVQAEQRYAVAWHLSLQVLQHRQGQPVSRILAAMVSDYPEEGQQVPLTQGDRNLHDGPFLARLLAWTSFDASSARIGGPYAERLMAAAHGTRCR